MRGQPLELLARSRRMKIVRLFDPARADDLAST
jgi:hypothetical protein